MAPCDVTFQRERLADLWPALRPLVSEHQAEVFQWADVPLDIDEGAYERAEAAGVVRCFTARAPSWHLLGYATFFVTPSLHHRSLLCAGADALFLRPEHRVDGCGRQFIAWCDEQLRAEGVRAVYHHCKAGHDFGMVLRHLGYELVERGYAKRLDLEGAAHG